MKKAIALILITFSMISCDSKQEYQTVTIEHKYSIELPSFLSEVNNLNPEASLQYQNPLREFYVLVLDEAKADFPNLAAIDLDGYNNLLRNNLESSIGNPVFSPTRDTLINGLKAKMFSLSGTTQGLDIHYEFAYLESDKNFYQILTWTLLNRKDKFLPDMKKIIASFKEKESRTR